MLSVMKRELRAYFYTPVGYVFTAIFWVLGASFFLLYNLMAASADLSSMFGNLSYLFMLIVPLLTMRLFSEEKRQKTDQLFYCSPTALASIVAGKFFAAMTVLVIALLGTGVYVGILLSRTMLVFGMLAAHYLSFLLLGAGYIAVGVLMSALTDSQVTAAVLTLAVNMLLQLVEMSAADMVVPYLPFLPELLGCIALNSRYASLTSGVIYPTDVGYFLVFVTVLLSATVWVLARRRVKRR